MTKERIVLETSEKRKAALVEKLSLQGDTLSDWLEEQLTLSMRDQITSEAQTSRSFLQNGIEPSEMLALLQTQDWSFTNDDTGYLTHDIHPYPAKFIPQIPSHLISILSEPGDVIFDPFGGSATTAVEAVRMGRRAVSVDANPLSGLIGRVKTGFLTPTVRADLDQLRAAVEGHIVSPVSKTTAWSETIIARHHPFVPEIPNIEKWFAKCAIAELALIRFLISETTEGLATDAALLALSRIILRVSFQDSETRYVAGPKHIPEGLALSAFAESLNTIQRRLERSAPSLQKADAKFIVADSRTEVAKDVGSASVDLIVTSPPYPNATDYHLYHRFRLFWLGFDPRKLGKIEIGSHLRHQRNGTGIEEYNNDMVAVLKQCYSVLKPGRYAVFVVGDALFKGSVFSTADAVVTAGKEVGFESIGVIERPLHTTKRSFSAAARRLRVEHLVIFRKSEKPVEVTLLPPTYRMWNYEVQLRKLEIEAISKAAGTDFSAPVNINASPTGLSSVRRLAFTHEYIVNGSHPLAQPTWQKVLENGDADGGKRKDPKYATHGLHTYKGKFYPQLAKSLMNISGINSGSRIFDPFCGSGTVPLEGMLNGFATFGCDLNPLAAKIARAKTGIFAVNRSVVELSLQSLLERLARCPKEFPSTRSQFDDTVLLELDRWFPTPVLDKLEWVLTQVRLFGEPTLVEFCEVILSSVIRDVSQQDPSDLRIRRRKKPLTDAPVVELFSEKLDGQLKRLQKYWSVAGRQPSALIPAIVQQGDSRNPTTLRNLGLTSKSIDCVVTSPPYATALPYIDTDRLSLMAIMGLNNSQRSGLEDDLTGSREIRRKEKETLESILLSQSAYSELPRPVVNALRNILRANQNSDVGFRRDNMASLLWRYFIDMKENLLQVQDLLNVNSKAYYVVGDSKTKAGESWTAIETCNHISAIASFLGFKARRLLDISVTTENYNHIKNAITENAVLEFTRIES
jgi:DNA modification methylase